VMNKMLIHPTRPRIYWRHNWIFWESDKSMMEAGEALHSNEKNVPTLLILASKDKNVPLDVTRTIQSWATRTVVVGGQGHEICDSVEDLRGTYHDYIPEIERFLDYCAKRRAAEGRGL
jgi:pimeloyl-ACP methyl ester carboxylesterase